MASSWAQLARRARGGAPLGWSDARLHSTRVQPLLYQADDEAHCNQPIHQVSEMRRLVVLCSGARRSTHPGCSIGSTPVSSRRVSGCFDVYREGIYALAEPSGDTHLFRPSGLCEIKLTTHVSGSQDWQPDSTIVKHEGGREGYWRTLLSIDGISDPQQLRQAHVPVSVYRNLTLEPVEGRA